MSRARCAVRREKSAATFPRLTDRVAILPGRRKASRQKPRRELPKRERRHGARSTWPHATWPHHAARTLESRRGAPARRRRGAERAVAAAVEIAHHRIGLQDQCRRRQGRAGRAARLLLSRERGGHRRHHAGLQQGFPQDQDELRARADRRALQQDPGRTPGRPLRRRCDPALRHRARLRLPEEGRLRTLRVRRNWAPTSRTT